MHSYIGNYNRYWECFQQSLHSSPPNSMVLPTNSTSSQTSSFVEFPTQSSLIRNSYLNPAIGNECTEQIKSAFKPVKPRSSTNPIPTTLPDGRNNNFNLSMHPSSADANNFRRSVGLDSQYGSITLENATNEVQSPNWSKKYEKTLKKSEKNFRMAYKYVADKAGQVGAVYQWDSLLPVLPEKESHKVLPTRQKRTRIIQHRHKFKTLHHQITQLGDNSVPIIDLTLEQEQTDKTEATVQILEVSPTSSQTNGTPPLDVNGNEIFIMQTTMNHRKQQQTDDSKKHYLSTNVNRSRSNSNGTQFKTNTVTPNSMDSGSKMVPANVQYNRNGIRVPPKKQIKLIAKHNQWHKQIRTYNGFRLFARRNQAYAKRHANESNNESIVNSVLVKWWNTTSANEKEHYAQVAEVIIESQARSTTAVAKVDNKTQNDFTVSEQINAITNLDRFSNELLSIDSVLRKNPDTKVDSIDNASAPANAKDSTF